jgi:hypothetical protein
VSFAGQGSLAADTAGNVTATWVAETGGVTSIRAATRPVGPPMAVDGSVLLVSAADGLSMIAAGGVRRSTLNGCPGSLSAFHWDGGVVVAATEMGWLCSWRSPSVTATLHRLTRRG